MNVKLADYSLKGYCPKEYSAQIGDKVCPANGPSKVGTIVQIRKADKYSGSWEGKNYMVVWNTGPQKGKTSEHRGCTLVNLKFYIAAVQTELNKITDLLQEANKYGL